MAVECMYLNKNDEKKKQAAQIIYLYAHFDVGSDSVAD